VGIEDWVDGGAAIGQLLTVTVTATPLLRWLVQSISSRFQCSATASWSD